MPTIKLRRVNYYATEITDGYHWWVRQFDSVLGKYGWGVTMPDGHGVGGFADTKEQAHQRVEATIADEKGKAGTNG